MTMRVDNADNKEFTFQIEFEKTGRHTWRWRLLGKESYFGGIWHPRWIIQSFRITRNKAYKSALKQIITDIYDGISDRGIEKYEILVLPIGTYKDTSETEKTDAPVVEE